MSKRILVVEPFRLRGRKRQKAYVITAPAGMLDCCALIAARAAAGALPQPSLDASAPQRMTATAQASGALLVAV